MHKQIIIILVLLNPGVSNLLSTLSLGEALAQVVIKDEIILDETIIEIQEPESAGLTMPFYGKVREEVYWYSIACGNGRTDLIVDGNYYPFGDCYYMNCGSENCFCQTGYHYKEIPNVPMGTSVDTKFQRCWIWNGNNNPPSWGELEHYFQLISATETQWKYEAKARMTINHPWEHAAYIYLKKTTPPGNCPNAGGNYCDSSSWVQIPDVELVPYSQGSTISNIECPKDPNRLAFFTPVLFPQIDRSNMYHLTSSDVIACYNQIGQTWQFNLNQSAKIYYAVEICSTNVSNKNLTYINSLSDTSIIPLNKCDIALRSFKGHLVYPYEIPNNGYVIKEALLFHENGHKDKFEEFKNDYFFIWETKIETFREQCVAYADVFEAREAGLNMYRYAFSEYYAEFAKTHNKLLGLGPYNKNLKDKEENRVNNRPEMKALVNRYIDALITRCKIN